MEWTGWLNKKVYVLLNRNRGYTGRVIGVDDKGVLKFITIRDKYDKLVTFLTTEIKIIQEEDKHNDTARNL